MHWTWSPSIVRTSMFQFNTNIRLCTCTAWDFFFYFALSVNGDFKQNCFKWFIVHCLMYFICLLLFVIGEAMIHISITRIVKKIVNKENGKHLLNCVIKNWLQSLSGWTSGNKTIDSCAIQAAIMKKRCKNLVIQTTGIFHNATLCCSQLILLIRSIFTIAEKKFENPLESLAKKTSCAHSIPSLQTTNQNMHWTFWFSGYSINEDDARKKNSYVWRELSLAFRVHIIKSNACAHKS